MRTPVDDGPKPWAPPSLIKVRCSVSHVRSSVSKSQVHVRNVRSSVCQCSKCSVFGILVFVPPLVESRLNNVNVHLQLSKTRVGSGQEFSSPRAFGP